ncbi:YIF1 family protein [Nitzschia inconspicua]|uniref:Protein YIF1 n=1 Tax=Nitzschia inconspicua TaxID=303405 RepID=A0A9K3L3X3_9STRA|nr:YIF1 family protein [Nitzschia inconspicua]
MASFYNNTSAGPGGSVNSGMYNSGGGMYGQQQQQSQPQQSEFSNNSNNMSQWQTPSSSTQQQTQYQQQPYGDESMSYGQPTSQQQQQQSFGRSSFLAGMQQQGTQVASQLVADFATGNLTSEKIGEKLMDGIGKGFGGGIPGLEFVMGSLRSYFAVDNRYVKRKMVKVLFPFTNKHWHRIQMHGPETINYALPNSDENAPDLYVPVMSLITYCLLCALCYGTAGQFNPEVIASVTTWCFGTQIVEVALIRFGLYLMNTSIPFLDLFAYTGYKYLGLTINILCGILFGLFENWGRTGFYITFVWTASAASFFMLKTMSNTIPTQTASTGPTREMMVIGFAASQAVTMWFVSQTKFL